MSKAENNKQIDADILRARDIISLHKQKARQKPQSQKTSENTTQSANAAEKSPQKAETLQEKAQIPRFDLAEDIMAEQRKITAIKRKAPGRKAEAERSQPQAGAAGHIIGQPTQGQLEQDRIIAEIVARDIERLCRGDTPDDKR